MLGYLRLVAGTARLTRTGMALAPRLLAARLDDGRRDRVKAAIVRRLLTGRDEAELRVLGRGYAARVVAERLRADTLTRLEAHRAEGHQIVIVSASPALYLDAVGEQLGVDAVLATNVEVGADGRLTGELAGANCRRAEKVRRLEAWLGGRRVELHAYGDSRGDHELLARADRAVRV